ncbi:MAG TPA: hypothetical protein VI685_13855 [Candidatus Angelobacter sp.]
MRLWRHLMVVPLLVAAAVGAQSHVVGWGNWTSITFASGQQIKVRPIMIDGRVKEYSTGAAHQVTENVWVVRRAFRINNALPQETARRPQWTWQLGGWLTVSSASGRISELKLPDFDPHASEVSWFQDYAAYCGATEDGSVHYMIVFQLGKRKPVLKKELYGQSCAAPKWERDPSRVSFEAAGGTKVSFLVHDGSAELQSNP